MPRGWRSEWRHRARSERILAILIGILGLLTVIYSVWPLWRALFPLEIDLDEPWNAFHAEVARAGGALYPDPDAFTANNYPPLSFLFIAATTTLTGFDPIYLGRVVSLSSVAIIAACIAGIVRRLGGSRLGAALAALWFLATMFRFFDGYVGKNDPHLPALATMVLALAWALHRHARGRPVEPAIFLMVVAGFYKHSLVATPAATLIWLARDSWRLALRAALLGAAVAALGLAACVSIYGDAFLHQLMMPRVHSVWKSLANLGQLQWIGPALAIWALWAWNDRGSDAARLSAIYIVTGLLAYLVQKLGEGIGVNAQFELVVASAIGLGCASSRALASRAFGPNADRVLIVAVLVLIARLLASTRVESYLLLASAEYRGQFARNSQVLADEVERIRNLPGPVHCTVMTVCVRAGKGFAVDLFPLNQRVDNGLITRDALNARLRAAHIRFVKIDPRASTDELRIPRAR